ncbi:HU family DNA-binding protein [Acinetobacter vivianii]
MTTEALNKSDLIERIALKNPHLAEPLVEDAVKIMIDQMIEALSSGDRIEIRGFGSFALHHREPRLGRNPKQVSQLMLQRKQFHTLNLVRHFVMQ